MLVARYRDLESEEHSWVNKKKIFILLHKLLNISENIEVLSLLSQVYGDAVTLEALKQRTHLSIIHSGHVRNLTTSSRQIEQSASSQRMKQTRRQAWEL